MDLYEELNNPINFMKWVPKRWVFLEWDVADIFSIVKKLYSLRKYNDFHYGTWWNSGVS